MSEEVIAPVAVVEAPVVAPVVPVPGTPGAAALLAPEVVAPVAVVAKPIPGKDAKPEEWVKFYELPVPEGQDGKFAEKASGWMAKAGASPEMAKALAAEWNAHTAELIAQQKAEADAAVVAHDAAVKRDEAALKNEWGVDGDKNTALAQRAAREFVQPFAGDKTTQIINSIESTIGYAATMKLMHAIGSKIGEASPRGLGESTKVASTPQSNMENSLRAVIDTALKR